MKKALNLTANLLLLLLGAESIGILIAGTFSVSVPSRTWFWLALLCVLLWAASSFRRGILIGMPLCAAVLWYLYRSDEEDLLIEFHDLMEHVNAAYFGHFGGGSAYLYTDQAAGHMTALLFILFLIAAFLSVSLVSGSFRISLTHLATIPLFAVCIAVNGKPPVLPVLGVLLFWCGVHLSGDAFRTDDGGGKSVLLGLIPCAAVLAGLLLLYNPANYHYDESDVDLSQRFDRFGNALSQWMNKNGMTPQGSSGSGESVPKNYEPPSGWRSGTDELVLTRGFDYSALDEDAFRVTSDAASSLYFRGKSYGEYRGNAWGAAIENTHAHALDYTARAFLGSRGMETRSFKLQSDVPYESVYLPYFSISNAENDVKFSVEGLGGYDGSFYRTDDPFAVIGNAVLTGMTADEEAQYRQYAHTYYTKLPESTRAEMEGICRSRGLSADRKTAELIPAVADLVRRQGIYDINAEPYTGSDYAVDFLSGTRRGYCIHFATAAAVVYRTLGIPARVCEGYLVTLPPGNVVIRDNEQDWHMENQQGLSPWVNVTGKDAHAWVEVYVDGVGWVPVEVTASPAESPNAAGQGTEAAPEQPEDRPSELDPDVSTETPMLPEDLSGGPNDGPENAEEPEDAPGGGELSPDGSGGASSSGKAGKVLRHLLLVLGVILLLFAAVYGWYRLMRSRLQARLKDPDGRKCAIAAYRQADRLRRWGAEMPADIRRTAEKAAFSQHEISDEERKACLKSLERLTDETWKSLNRRQKLVFRYLFGNI